MRDAPAPSPSSSSSAAAARTKPLTLLAAAAVAALAISTAASGADAAAAAAPSDSIGNRYQNHFFAFLFFEWSYGSTHFSSYCISLKELMVRALYVRNNLFLVQAWSRSKKHLPTHVSVRTVRR